MNRKIRDGWHITKLSFIVLMKDKNLILLPVMAGVMQLMLILIFLFPFGLEETITTLYAEMSASDFEDSDSLIVSALFSNVLLLFLLMFLSATIANFFQAAVIYAASCRFNGENPTMADALSAAVENFIIILKWSFLESGVLFLIQLLSIWLEEKGEYLASFITDAVGVTWSLVTQLMLPVVVLENRDTGKGVERSWYLFKKSWGEQVVGVVSFYLLGLLIIIPAGVLASMFYITMDSPQIAIYTFLAGLGLMQVVTFSLQGIWRTALYFFAMDEEAPSGFDNVDFTSAFKPK